MDFIFLTIFSLIFSSASPPGFKTNCLAAFCGWMVLISRGGSCTVALLSINSTLLLPSGGWVSWSAISDSVAPHCVLDLPVAARPSC